jgi:hypothetical protein
VLDATAAENEQKMLLYAEHVACTLTKVSARTTHDEMQTLTPRQAFSLAVAENPSERSPWTYNSLYEYFMAQYGDMFSEIDWIMVPRGWKENLVPWAAYAPHYIFLEYLHSTAEDARRRRQDASAHLASTIGDNVCSALLNMYAPRPEPSPAQSECSSEVGATSDRVTFLNVYFCIYGLYRDAHMDLIEQLLYAECTSLELHRTFSDFTWIVQLLRDFNYTLDEALQCGTTTTDEKQVALKSRLVHIHGECCGVLRKLKRQGVFGCTD